MGDTPFEPLFLPPNIIHLTWQKHFRCLKNSFFKIISITTTDFSVGEFHSPHLIDSGAIYQRARANKWIENAGVSNLHTTIEVHLSSVANRAFLMPFSVKLAVFWDMGHFLLLKKATKHEKMPHFCVLGNFWSTYVVKTPFFHGRWGIFSFRQVGNPAPQEREKKMHKTGKGPHRPPFVEGTVSLGQDEDSNIGDIHLCRCELRLGRPRKTWAK